MPERFWEDDAMKGNVRLILAVLVLFAVLTTLGGVFYKALFPAPPPEPIAQQAVSTPKPQPGAPVDKPAPVRAAEAAVPAPAAPPVLESEASKSGPGQIIGTVFDNDGQPAPDVPVLALYCDWYGSDDAPQTWSTVSDAEGRFNFSGLPSHQYQLKAATEDALAVTWAYVMQSWLLQSVDLVLQPAWSLQGVVKNAEGAAVAGAKINPAKSETNPNQSVGKLLEVRSDAEGRFRFAVLPENPWKFLVEAEGYPHLISDTISPKTGEVEFVLGAGGSLAGRAAFADSGAPTPNLEVVAWSKEPPSDRYKVTTGGQGEFVFDALRPAEYMLSVHSDTLVLAKDAFPVSIGVGEKKADVLVEVATGGVITGKVRDRDSGAGLSGVTLNAYPDQSGPATILEARQDIKTDAEGLYRIEGLGAGRFRLRCDAAKGYKAPGWAEFPYVAILPGQEVPDINIDLARTPAVSGVVQDTKGAAVARAQVEARSSDGQYYSTTASDSSGRFSLDGFTAGLDVTITARSGNMICKALKPYTVTEQGLSGVVLVLDTAAGGSIEGTVVDGNGRPQAFCYVMAYANDMGMLRPPQVSADAEGKFKIFRLPAGTYRLQVRGAKNHSYSSGNQDQVILAEGEKRTGVQLVLDMNPATAISGRILDSKGKPLPNANVNAQGPAYAFSMSEADGSYTLSGLKEGNYTVYAECVAYSAEQREEVPAGSKNVDFRLEGTGAIEGNVVNAATGKPVTRFSLTYTKGSESTMPTSGLAQVNDPEGHFLIPNVQVGENTVFVKAAGFAPASHVIPKVVSGETVRNIRISLEGGGRVEGVVVDGDGAPISGVKVFVGNIPSNWERNQTPAAATSGADGTFALDTLSPEDNRISAYHPGYAPATAAVTPSPGQPCSVRIVLGSGGQIEGAVTMDGEPLPNVYISADKAEILGRSDSANGNSDDTGAYRLRGLSDGDFLVRAYWRNPQDLQRNRSLERSATIEAGQVTVVDFNFAAANSVIEGQITVDGKAVPGSRVSARILTADGEERSWAEADAQGMYRLEPLPAGYVYITGVAAEREKIVELELGAGQSLRQDIAFGGAGSLVGTVTGLLEKAENGVAFLNGEVPIPENPTPLDVLTLQRLVVKTAAPDAVGFYRAEEVEPGVYTVVAYSVPESLLGLRFSHAVIEIKPNEESAFDFNLE